MRRIFRGMAGLVAVILLVGAPVLAVKMGGFGGLLLVALLLLVLVGLPLGDAYFLGTGPASSRPERPGQRGRKEEGKEVVE